MYVKDMCIDQFSALSDDRELFELSDENPGAKATVDNDLPVEGEVVMGRSNSRSLNNVSESSTGKSVK
jgi:hypothetical protein